MRILIGIPTYDRRLDIELVKALIDQERLGKYEFDYLFPVSSHLCRNRNLCVKEALASKHDALLFLDSDMGFPDPSFIDKMLETAYRFDAKIVGGAYRMKKVDGSLAYIAGMKKGDKYENFNMELKHPQIVNALGTGTMLIFREVLETVEDPWFTIIDKPNLEVMPEDYEFCRRAEEKGFKIAIDPRFETHHYGNFSWTHGNKNGIL